MRITLNGDLGSGKSTIGARLSERLGVPFLSTGKIFREIGRIANMDALQTNLAAEDNSEIDFLVDKKIQELDVSTADFIIDSRMAWHFVHGATKVFLTVSPLTAASRVMMDKSRSSEVYTDDEDAAESLRKRRDSELKRYKRLYGVEIDDVKNYDLVIVTDNADVDDIVTLILEFSNHKRSNGFWIPKSRLVPMNSIRSASGQKFSTRFTGMDQKFQIEVYLVDNFGFFFGAATELVNAFHYDLSLVPFADKKPAFLKRDKTDIPKLAKASLQLSDIYDWEEIGHVKLAFAEHLQKDSEVRQHGVRF
jgi:predicted cytidylate kinase